MKQPENCMKQMHECLSRFFEGRPFRLSDKWKALKMGENLLLLHYHHPVLVYDIARQVIVTEWWEKPADKRGLDSAKIWLKAYHKENDSIKEKVECEVCSGTGESDYGPALWQTHICGKCNGKGYCEKGE